MQITLKNKNVGCCNKSNFWKHSISLQPTYFGFKRCGYYFCVQETSLTGGKWLWANFFANILNQSHKELTLHNVLSENFLLTRNFWPVKLFTIVWPAKAAFHLLKICGLLIHLFGSYTPQNKLINRPVLDQKIFFGRFSKLCTIKLIGSFLLLRKKLKTGRYL